MSGEHVKKEEEEVFRAVSDPTRRAILDRLKEKDCSVNELCESFEITQPAISQHLQILKAVGLVTVQQVGRRRIHRLNGVMLQAVYDWVSHYEQFWTGRLDALGKYLEKKDKENDKDKGLKTKDKEYDERH
jgi:DNA-binding transcriptional ArsR family regulator